MKIKKAWWWVIAVIAVYALAFALYFMVQAYAAKYTVYAESSSQYAELARYFADSSNGWYGLISAGLTPICILMLSGLLISRKISPVLFVTAFYAMFAAAYICAMIFTAIFGQLGAGGKVLNSMSGYCAAPLALSAILFYLLESRKKLCTIIVGGILLLDLFAPNVLSTMIYFKSSYVSSVGYATTYAVISATLLLALAVIYAQDITRRAKAMLTK